MAEFGANTERSDLYKNFKYRIAFEKGKYVAGVSKISALKSTTAIVEHRPGGDVSTNRISPGRTKFEPITLERGVTHDADFDRWANAVYSYSKTVGAKQITLADHRKNIAIDVFNEAGQRVVSYLIYRCWVSEFTALPDLNANAEAVAIQSIQLQHEGWERETLGIEPEKESDSET